MQVDVSAPTLLRSPLGIEILDVAPGSVRIAMTVRADMVNGYGMCHGGIVFAFADSAFAFACNSYGDPMVAAGAEHRISGADAAGERVIATATEVSRGARHGIYDVAVTRASGTVLAQFPRTLLRACAAHHRHPRINS